MGPTPVLRTSLPLLSLVVGRRRSSSLIPLPSQSSIQRYSSRVQCSRLARSKISRPTSRWIPVVGRMNSFDGCHGPDSCPPDVPSLRLMSLCPLFPPLSTCVDGASRTLSSSPPSSSRSPGRAATGFVSIGCSSSAWRFGRNRSGRWLRV